VTTLVDKIVAIHTALQAEGLPHGFGGALALAWCTQRARGTIDIDVNIFVGPADAKRALAALPGGVSRTASDRRLLERDGQARLWWDETPVDVFLNTTSYHDGVAERCRLEWFSGLQLPVPQRGRGGQHPRRLSRPRRRPDRATAGPSVLKG
jgi:hypothetical protein